MPRRPARLLEVEQAALASHVTPVVCCDVVPLFVSLGTLECWGGRQEECGPELCVRQLRVCGSQLAVCLVSLFVSVCRSCVSSSSVSRPPIPRWCPVRAEPGCSSPFYLPTYTEAQLTNRGSRVLRASISPWRGLRASTSVWATPACAFSCPPKRTAPGPGRRRGPASPRPRRPLPPRQHRPPPPQRRRPAEGQGVGQRGSRRPRAGVCHGQRERRRRRGGNEPAGKGGRRQGGHHKRRDRS